ncbi:MAG: hypothetical protein QOG65_1448 [Actinomycetota bacterium]|jgi:hypothetical protein|nr:hypothetical protein [Actinomycetota bacterium]MDQ1384069.1 hypothetical protein [Actinomycetota bacterium]
MTPNHDPAGSGKVTRISPESRPRPDAAWTVYDDVVVQLRDRGWVKGVHRKGDAMCLVAAIDAAVGVGDAVTGTTAAKLARAGRVGSHLRDIVGVRNLAAWSDEPSRTLDEVLQLLFEASVAFPED